MVSINLCTDQLAMMLAKPGQIISVSALARDPMVSLMADEARMLGMNDAQAESVYLQHPDLVLAGDYSAAATDQMLRRLGIRVETVAQANSVADVRAGILRMGDLLGNPEGAARIVAQFDADLAALPPVGTGPLSATYEANGYTTGRLTLSGDVLRHSGHALLTDKLGFDYGGNLPLEVLVMGAPALVVHGSRYDRPSRSEDILDHPALAELTATRISVPDRDWICGLPHVLAVAGRLAP